MAALEGLAVGVPVIAPQAGPFPFMITRGVNGLLFEVNSVTDLRRTLEQILDDTLLRASLARGALEYENRRAASCITFGDALNSTLSIIDHGRRRAL
jgi:glycosyltransferase involved in cell wall biosynthesis